MSLGLEDIHTLLQHVGEPSADIASALLDFHTLLRGVRVSGGVHPWDSMSFVVKRSNQNFSAFVFKIRKTR